MCFFINIMVQYYRFIYVGKGGSFLKNMKVNLPEKSYYITIQNGLFSKIGKTIKKTFGGTKVFIITDENVNRLYGQKLCLELKNNNYIVDIHVIKPGETSKSLKELEKIYCHMVDFQLTRSDLIITFGGGVVGDLGGFAASTFLRGVPYIQIPTTLLAQIDSSIGGKVAVDLESGKNLVGSFYHPMAVLIDPEFLRTLPERVLHDGIAEAIKYGAIKDEELFNKLFSFGSDEELLSNIEEIIYLCCNIKRNIVELDERDTGERMLLNFGHTIGHAIEQYYNYSKYTHGEAVAIGMYWITEKSQSLGITKAGNLEKIGQMLGKYKLPLKVNGLESKDIIEIIARDKKMNGDKINLILLKAIGDGFIHEISFSKSREFI